MGYIVDHGTQVGHSKMKLFSRNCRENRFDFLRILFSADQIDAEPARVLCDLASPRVVNGKALKKVVRFYKSPGHGKSQIDSQEGRFKAAMRNHEQQHGAFNDTDLGRFCSCPSRNRFDEEAKVLHINFNEEGISPYSGSLIYSYNTIEKMNTRKVIKDSIEYNCGIRHVRCAKGSSVTTAGKRMAKFAFANNLCPQMCSACLTGDDFCSNTIGTGVLNIF